MEGILLNPVQWALGIAYMLVYVRRAQLVKSNGLRFSTRL